MPPTSIKDDEGFKGLFPKGVLIHSRYEVISEGTMGGMGMVYKCRDTRHKTLREVALKLMQPKFLDSKDAIERFQHEASISRDLLHHQNIVRVYHDDQWEDENGVVWHYLLMEWIEGRSLRDLINERRKINRPFTSREAYRIISQIAAALSYAHDCKEKIIHRDIKPENILITDEETLSLKVVDFGIAKILNLRGLTELSTPLGVSPYMSPELKLGSREVDHRTDIYSVGVVLYELLTLDSTIGPYRPSELNGETTQGIDEIYKRAVAPKIEQRYQTVKALSDDLFAEVAKKAQAPSKPKRLRSVAVALAAVVLLAGLVAAYVGYEHKRREAAREMRLATERLEEQQEKERLALEEKRKRAEAEKEVKEEEPQPKPAVRAEKPAPPKANGTQRKEPKWKPLVKKGPPIHPSRSQDKDSSSAPPKPAQGLPPDTEPGRREGPPIQEAAPKSEPPAKQEAETPPRRPQPPVAGFAPSPPRKTADDHFQRGLQFAKTKDYLQALGEFSRALEINPNHEPSYYWRGVAQYRLNNYHRAIDDFTIAINLAPRYLYFHWRGATYFRLNNCTRAVDDFTKALRIKSTSIDHNFRGTCYQRLGRYMEAEADYRKAAELGHSNTNVRNNP